MSNSSNVTQNGINLIALQPDSRSLSLATPNRQPIELELLEPIGAMPRPVIIQPVNRPQDISEEEQAELWAEAEDLLRRGDLFLMQGDIEVAIAHYQRALDFAPNLVDAHQGLAEALTQQGHLEAAATHYQQAIALLPTPGETTSEPIAKKISEPIAASGIPSRQNAIDADRSKPSIEQLLWYEQAAQYLQQGKTYCDRQQWQDAILVCKQAAELLAPRLAMTFRLLGRAWQAEQQLEAAEQSYSQSIAIDPTVAETHARLGSLYEEQQRLSEAVTALQQAIELDPKFAGAYLKLGAVWKQLGDSVQAADSLYQAYQLDPDQMTTREHLQLGNLLMSQGKFEQASECYRRVVQLVPKSPNGYHNLAVALSKQQNWSEAVYYHQQAIDRQPDDPRLHAALGQALTKLNRWQEAIGCYERVISLMPEYALLQEALLQIERCQRAILAESYGKMAATLAAEQQWQEAIHCYRQAIDRNPQSAEFHTGLAQVFAEVRQWDHAIACYKDAIALEPAQVERRVALAELLIQLGRFEEATQFYRPMTPDSPDRIAGTGLAEAAQSAPSAPPTPAYTVL